MCRVCSISVVLRPQSFISQGREISTDTGYAGCGRVGYITTTQRCRVVVQRRYVPAGITGLGLRLGGLKRFMHFQTQAFMAWYPASTFCRCSTLCYGSRFLDYFSTLLFSHKLFATTQFVVTRPAPITLERRITSGGKQIKTEDNTHNN